MHRAIDPCWLTQIGGPHSIASPRIRKFDIKQQRRVNILNTALYLLAGAIWSLSTRLVPNFRDSFPNHFFRMKRAFACDVTAAIFVGLNKEIEAFLMGGNDPWWCELNIQVSEWFLPFRPINLTVCHVSENHLLIGQRFFCATNLAAITATANDANREKTKNAKTKTKTKTKPQSL